MNRGIRISYNYKGMIRNYKVKSNHSLNFWILLSYSYDRKTRKNTALICVLFFFFWWVDAICWIVNGVVFEIKINAIHPLSSNETNLLALNKKMYQTIEWFLIEYCQGKAKVIPTAKQGKENTLQSQSELKVKTSNYLKRKGNAGDKVVIDFSFASDLMKEWRESFRKNHIAK